MAMEKIMYGFEGAGSITKEEILHLLIKYDKNIKMKTRTKAPLEMSAIDAYIKRAGKLKLSQSAEFWKDLRDSLDQRMVSYGEGAGRKEIIQALSEARTQVEQNRKFLDRLLGKSKDGGL